MDDSRLADECTVLRSNLRHAVFNKETLTIGGGEFDAKLVSDILEMYIRISMKQGMNLASLKDVKEDREFWRDTAKELASEVKRLKEVCNDLSLEISGLQREAREANVQPKKV
jgi:hypothetical protein